MADNKALDPIKQLLENKAANEAKTNNSKIYELQQMLPLDDKTDTGQAEKFCKWTDHHIAWSAPYGWLTYTETGNGGGYWQGNSDKLVERLYIDFTDEQRLKLINSPWANSHDDADKVIDWLKFIKHCRNTYSTIKSVLGISAALYNLDMHRFDHDGYLLNTQTGVVDLRTGEQRPAKPQDLMRHICSKGLYSDDLMQPERKIWHDFLDAVVVDQNGNTDHDYQVYLQLVAGLAAFGFVKVEKLYMAYGNGGNGKSTLFDSIARVMGSYAKSMSSDVLVDDGKGSRNFSKADLHGARLVVMSEFNKGVKLNSKILKEIVTTGTIRAEYKYKDSFEFTPVHTGIMYTNDLPNVPASDNGTWDRLAVMPFYARFRGEATEIKDYTSELVETAGNAILEWIIQGACMVYSLHFKFDEPLCVQQLVNEYRGRENKALPFIQDCCTLDIDATSDGVNAAALYKAYQAYAEAAGDDVVTKGRFRQDVMQITGQAVKRNAKGEYFPCIKLITSTASDQ